MSKFKVGDRIVKLTGVPLWCRRDSAIDGAVQDKQRGTIVRIRKALATILWDDGRQSSLRITKRRGFRPIDFVRKLSILECLAECADD